MVGKVGKILGQCILILYTPPRNAGFVIYADT